MSQISAFSLAQKVALVTGASSGIGRQTAILFASLGAELSLVGRDKGRLEETAEECKKASAFHNRPSERKPFICISADLSETAQIDMAYKTTIDHFQQLDILVNNAGCLIRDNVETLDLNVFEQVMNTNLKSAVYLTHKAVQALTETKGCVVNVSSVCGNRSFPGILSYCMSKAALDQFTKCSALELAPKGIRVNSVNPGVIITPLQRRGGMSESEYAAFLKRSEESHALGRAGEVTEVAQAIAFLASSASSFTTGDLLTVDGGRHAMCPR